MQEYTVSMGGVKLQSRGAKLLNSPKGMDKRLNIV